MAYKDLDKRREAARIATRRHRERAGLAGKWRTKVRDAARHATERAQAYGTPSVLSERDAAALLCGSQCFWCGAHDIEIGQRSIDHVVPLVRGGTNDLANLVLSCKRCNHRKFLKTSPGAWAVGISACLRCERADRDHLARGLCSPCYFAIFTNPNRRPQPLKERDQKIRRILEGEFPFGLVGAFVYEQIGRLAA